MKRQPREGSLAVALGACLRAPDERLVQAAMLVIAEALEGSDGVATRAAARLGVPERTFRKWLAQSPSLQAMRSKIQQKRDGKNISHRVVPQ